MGMQTEQDHEFDRRAYQRGYAEAASMIDTYGVEMSRRNFYPNYWSPDFILGYQTCIGVTLERELQG